MPGEIMIITGEASGDLYGSLLASELRAMAPDVRLVGVGGEAMRKAGVEILLDPGEISVVGVWEALVRIRRLRKALNRIRREIYQRRPDLLVLVDYPGMNLRLAGFARRIGVRVMYYISPQVWAWGKSRIGLVKRSVDKMVVILPFEVELYRREGVDVTYVGHPLIDIVKTDIERGAFRARMGMAEDERLVALLPGSRRQEIKHHMRPLLETAAILRRSLAGIRFVMVTLPSSVGMVRKEMGEAVPGIDVATDMRYEAIAYSDLAITCSGTVTLEAALLGTPMIVIYRLAAFSWMLGRLIVRVPYISLVNLVARQMVVPEFIQAEVRPEKLAGEAARLLSDDARRRYTVERLGQVRSRLGPGGATKRAAEVALSLTSR